MPTLNWIGKDKVVNHHQEVPYRVLEHKFGFRDGEQTSEDTGSGNMIIHGDNLLALKSLLPKYQGKINCIYIDPPYNTGNEGWVYNDNVNSEKIKQWLGNVVGKEGEDFSRHDKWLCMMYPRLKLLHQLLSPSGIIFISIDDNEYSNLKFLCDDIWGIRNYIATIIWDLGTGTTAGHFTRGHEYILCYAKDKSIVENFRNTQKNQTIRHGALKKISKKNPPVEITFPKGFPFEGDAAIFEGELGGSEKEYILSPTMEFRDGKLVAPVTIRAGFAMRKQVEDYIAKKEVFDTKGQRVTRFYFNKKGILFYEKEKTIINPRTVLSGIANTKNGTEELKKIFGDTSFDFPKPSILIGYLIELVSDENSIILDSFAGSGTTAHAVLNLNKDGGNRKFILVEMEDYADSITTERVRRVISGYADTEGTGGAFDYYELGAPLFREDGNLNEEVGEDKIREYIFFSETHQNLPENTPDNRYLLGNLYGTAYYFYYERDSITTLNHETLRQIVTKKAEQYIIYADTCTLTEEEMSSLCVIFKKIPRDIKRF